MEGLKILSVAEDNGQSDRLSAMQTIWIPGCGARQLYISIDTKRNLTLRKVNGIGTIFAAVEFKDIDIDGLIEYLKEVKTFLSEEEMVKKLTGKQYV